MNQYNDNLKLKLAWQIAYERRTCPPSKILYAEKTDNRLQEHLSFCETCRENLKMPQEEKAAWQKISDKMTQSVKLTEGVAEKIEGQIWSLRETLGGWQKDGCYFSPPSVLLLSKQKTSLWMVAQLFEDQRLAGDGDIALDECFGFAEGWNCYLINDNELGRQFGTVTSSQLQHVLAASSAIHKPVNNGSILYFFRKIEREIGSTFGLKASKDQESATEKTRELIPGMELLISGAKKYLLNVSADTLGILRGTFKPALVVRGKAIKSSAKKLTKEQKQLIKSVCFAVPIDVKFSVSEVLITLKWLGVNPIEQYDFQCGINGTILKDINISCNKSGILRISSKDPCISEVSNHKISNMKLSLSDDAISIALFLEKNRAE